MDVDEFDESIFLNWENQIDALSYANIEFPVEDFLDDFLDIEENITVLTCAGSDPANVVPSLLGLTENANSVQSHVCFDSAGVLEVTPPTCDAVVLQPTLINSSPDSAVTTCVNDSELLVPQGSCVTKETSPLITRARKNQSRAARISRKKIKTNVSLEPVRQFNSNVSTQLPTPGEHILRERNRRDDMARRLLILDKVLPEPPARRQKAVIVEDTIKFVKSLKLRKEDLLKRRAHMKLMLLNRNKSEPSPEHSSYGECKTHSSYEKSAGEMQVTPSPISDRRNKLFDISTIPKNRMGQSPQHPIAAADATVENVTPSKLLQIHAQVSDDEVFVEMLFHKYSPNLHSRVMQTVETLKLEVIRGSMQRSMPCGNIECLITAKPRLECQSRRQGTRLSSTTLLVAALQAAFTHV